MTQRVMESDHVELRPFHRDTLDYALAACYRIARERARAARTRREETFPGRTQVPVTEMTHAAIQRSQDQKVSEEVRSESMPCLSASSDG